MLENVCVYLELISRFLLVGKLDYFIELNDTAIDLWCAILDANNWGGDFFNLEEMKKYVDRDGKHLRGYRPKGESFEYVNIDEATFEELRWYVIRHYLKPAIMKAYTILEADRKSTFGNYKLRRLFNLCEKWRPLC